MFENSLSLLCRVLLALILLLLAGCRSAQRDPNTVVFLIESSPASLDPRVGSDAFSEHIDELLFDGLVARDRNFHSAPPPRERCHNPDPKPLVFHPPPAVRFHAGRLLTSRDVAGTINPMRAAPNRKSTRLNSSHIS